MTEDEIKAAAVAYVRSLDHYQTFTPSGLQRALKCGYRAAIATIDQMIEDGIITTCPWTYMRADRPLAPAIMSRLRALDASAGDTPNTP